MTWSITLRAVGSSVGQIDALPELLQDEQTLLWVDLEAPTAEEIAHVGEVLDWNPLLVEDLIHQGQRAKLDSFGDHRIAMAFSIAALAADGESTIHGAEAASVSFPEFFDVLRQVTA